MVYKQIKLILMILLFALNASANNKCDGLFISSEKNEVTKDEDITLPTLEQVEKSKSLSQLIRSNAYHFWRWAKMKSNEFQGSVKKKTEFIKKLISFEGIVMGDAHLGNIHKIFDYIKGKLKWKNIDLDDAGKGSYLFDFVHLVLSVKVVGSHNISTTDMVKAYTLGLKGKDMKVPDSIKEFTGLSSQEFEAKRAAYVKKKITEDGKFKLSKELIEFDPKLIGAKSRTEVESVLKDNLGDSIIILDLALVVQERGGGTVSGENPLAEGEVANKRIWALLEIEGKKHIYEIKENGEPGLNGYQKQENAIDNFNHSRDFFGYSDKELFLVKIGDTIYYVREKKITLFDVPYDQKNKKEIKFLRDLGNWGAYQLGLMHRENPNAAEYTELVTDNPELFIEVVKDLRKDYQKIPEGILKEKKKNKKKHKD